MSMYNVGDLVITRTGKQGTIVTIIQAEEAYTGTIIYIYELEIDGKICYQLFDEQDIKTSC